jgi:dTDP-4-dehydrorhamnose 3,5-epimerase
MKEDLAFRLADFANSKEMFADSITSMEADQRAESLPQGVSLRPLHGHQDERGSLTELFRASWDTGIHAVQWNYVESEGSVLRGVHLHLKHSDCLILLSGHATIGLRDLRRDSSTPGLTALIELLGSDRRALTIPPGVAHGFYFHKPSTHVYGVSEFWDPQDELGCHWADPDLEISWPNAAPVISARDAALPSLRTLIESLHHARQT